VTIGPSVLLIQQSRPHPSAGNNLCEAAPGAPIVLIYRRGPAEGLPYELIA
jgi:hypothetical protein